MDRRTFIGTVGAGTVAGVAGCLTRDGGGNGDGDDGTLRIATYDSMVNTENSAGPWLKEAFEAEHDAEIEWTVPDQGLTQYVRSARENADVDADAYVGVNVDDLVRIDDELGDGELLQELEVDRLDNADRIRDELEMGDPHGRVLPYDTGYICLVYDETLVDEPETLEDLTEPAYEDALLAQNAQNSDPGRAFLLWTIDAHGEGGYLDYWGDLEDNGVPIDAVKFTASSKRDLIDNLATRLEMGEITIPEIPQLTNELDLYEYETTPSGNVRYQAPEGWHDDCVDSLALAAHEGPGPRSATWGPGRDVQTR